MGAPGVCFKDPSFKVHLNIDFSCNVCDETPNGI